MFGAPRDEPPATPQSKNVTTLVTTTATGLFQSSTTQAGLASTNSPKFGLFSQSLNESSSAPTPPPISGQAGPSVTTSLFGAFRIPQNQPTTIFKTSHFGTSMFGKSASSDTTKTPSPFSNIGGTNLGASPPDVKLVFGTQKTHQNSSPTFPQWYSNPEKPSPQLPVAFSFASQVQEIKPGSTPLTEKSTKRVTFSFGGSNKEFESSSNVESTAPKNDNVNPFLKHGGVFRAEIKKVFQSEAAKLISSLPKTTPETEQAQTILEIVEPITKTNEPFVEVPVKLTGIKSRLSLPLKKPSLKGPTGKSTRSKRRSPTGEEISQITTIFCKEVPEDVNKKEFMTKHFSKFGKIKLVKCNPKKKDTTVSFYDHKSALAAKTNGASLGPAGPDIIIFWRALASKSKDGRRRTSSSEIEDELLSMAGGSFNEPKILSRPDSVGKDSTKKIVTKEHVKTKKPETSTSGLVPDESLHSILEKPATEIGDHYKILDARDKLMRMKTRKQSDINKATAVIGTCPDMCPEKERYSRTEKYGLSLFEQYQPGMESLTSGKMNPKAVIKEYSRSSADQEEPLSHELRPPQTLQLTMDYLLCNVMDFDSSAGEWFDFIWNRTRAIRKDLTQQHLCDPVCVSLVEKCARFHIHCSAALCDEDISAFDPKINNENLTKCLQTLKHFYDDLTEKGIFCPNEAEFRAYDILLNLNEGDIIRQAQQFSQIVRKSEIFRFSTEVFFAHSCNNYVRFFRLVRSAPYLAACILQRYFQRIRIKALVAICKAYRKPNSIEQFSVAKLTDLLGFENMEESEQFCHWLELQTTSAKGVLLQKPNVPTSGAPTPTQSTNLIHSKRKTSVGQIVNGGPLSSNPYLTYEPHDSFDSDGRLRKEAYDAQDQAVKVLKQMKSFVEVVTSVSSSPTSPVVVKDSILQSPSGQTFLVPTLPSILQPSMLQPSYNKPEEIQISQEALQRKTPEEVVYNIVTDLSMEVVPTLSLAVAQEVIFETKMQFCNSFANQTAATIISDTVNIMSRDISITVLEEAHNKKAEREERERIHQFATDLSNSFIEDVLTNECFVISKQVASEARNELLETIAAEVLLSTWEEVVSSDCSLVAYTIYHEEKAWAEKVKVFMTEKKLERAKKLFRRWHSICVSRRTFEQVKLMFPCGPLMAFEATKRIKLDAFSLLPIEDQAKQARKTNNLITASLCYHLLDHELSKQPIDVLNVVKDCLVKDCIQNNKTKLIMWKVAVFLPFESKENCLSDWICNKFHLSFTDQPVCADRGLLVSKPKFDMWSDSSIHLCTSVQALRSSEYLSIESLIPIHTLKGLSALLVIIEVFKDRTNLNGKLRKCKDYLQDVLSIKPMVPPIPLAFVVLINEQPLTAREEENLLRSSSFYLDILRASGLISQFHINLVHPSASSVDINKKLEEILVWFAENSPEVPVLTSSYLQDFLEDGIKTFVLNPVFEDLAYKQKCFKTDLQSPNAIVYLYNATLQFLADIVSQDYLKCISWPAPEFCHLNPDLFSPSWNSPLTLRNLYGQIISLQLKECSSEGPFNIEGAYKWVEKFSEDLEPRIQKMFFSQFESEVRRLSQSDTFSVHWAKLLTNVFSNMCAVNNRDHNGKEIVVHYFVEDLQTFRFPTDWLISTTEASTEMALERSLLMFNSPPADPIQIRRQPHSQSPKSSKQVQLLGVEYYSSPAQCQTSRLSQSLDQCVLQERKESVAFTRRLLSLAGETSPSSYFESSLFDWSPVHIPKKKSNEHPKKDSSLPENLDDSLNYIKHSLKCEKESSILYKNHLKLLEK